MWGIIDRDYIAHHPDYDLPFRYRVHYAEAGGRCRDAYFGDRRAARQFLWCLPVRGAVAVRMEWPG